MNFSKGRMRSFFCTASSALVIASYHGNLAAINNFFRTRLNV
jgi:hypothetical protein